MRWNRRMMATNNHISLKGLRGMEDVVCNPISFGLSFTCKSDFNDQLLPNNFQDRKTDLKDLTSFQSWYSQDAF